MFSIKQGDSKFFIGEDEQHPDAKITFKPLDGNKIDVDHTFVSKELEGQGIAGKLVERIVQYAREEGKMIVPTCSYTKQKMEKTPAYHDVLAK